MTDFLLELCSEEIPARMQAGARAELEKLFRREMDAAGVAVGELTVWSTPRRLALIARGLPLATEAVSEEAKGPPVGAPDAAVDGFCAKNGVTRDQLEARDVKGRQTWFAVIERPGRATREVLAVAIPAIVRDFSWPKSMRWGAASLSTESPRWVRPLSGIVALLGAEVVECEAGGVNSGNVTKGHRFHHSGEIIIGSACDYQEKLRACHVIVDHAERQDRIRAGAAKVAAEAGLALVADEGLVIENAGLTEWPVPLLGRFDEAFLDVPPEVIQLTARVNQKYFVCEGAEGKLADAFVCTANITAADGGAALVDGNRKVLAARLSDARFFWEQDRKVALSDHAQKLERITFHEKLGTVADKVERVAKLARWLCEEGVVAGNPDLAEQAARLCKADLVTEMVGEFPELQGLMGGYYARAEGLPDEVADAIRDHYKPVGQGDEVPTAPVTVAVSLADKLDSLISFFAISMAPTGSKDPFALRRAGLGINSIISRNNLRLPLYSVIQQAAPETLADEKNSSFRGVIDFLADRLKVQQREAGVRHDLIDAVFALGGEDDLVRLLARVHALQAFMGSEDGANLLAAYKRAANILKKEGVEAAAQIALSYTPEPAEKALIDALDAAEPQARAAVAAEDFAGAMAALASLRGPIDRFFDEVTVNADEEIKRTARLALLARFRDAVHRVADFSRIEG
ncbi:MAG: glycine--tRNA ligase subunit beta [Sphingomonadaceae bacterium]